MSNTAKTKAAIRDGHLQWAIKVGEITTSATVYFSTEAQAVEFFGKLPKYVKARLSRCSGSYEGEFKYGIRWHLIPGTEKYPTAVTYGVQFFVSGINRTTGDRNEMGDKRRAAFIKAIEDHLEIVSDLTE